MKAILSSDKVMQLLALIGLFDAFYLVNLHYSDGVCVGELQTIGSLTVDCGAVASSDYSEIFGIPIALFGFLYYLTVFLLLNFEDQVNPMIEKYNINTLHVTLGIITIGFLISVWLFYLQIFVLELICTYCMVSVFTSTFLFAVNIYIITMK